MGEEWFNQIFHRGIDRCSLFYGANGASELGAPRRLGDAVVSAGPPGIWCRSAWQPTRLVGFVH
jgi:hypothetical protein